MKTLVYLLQVSACTGIFYLFYRVVLARFTFFALNRWYLLATLLFSFAIPVIRIPASSPQPLDIIYRPVRNIAIVQPPSAKPSIRQHRVAAMQGGVTQPAIDWIGLLSQVYLCITVLLTVHLAVTFAKLIRRIRGKVAGRFGHVKIINDQQSVKNASFMHYIFLSGEGLSEAELKKVLDHELIHIRLFHSADRVAALLARVLLWFNPFSYLYVLAIEENHEFEVDQRLTQGSAKHEYAELLVRLAMDDHRLFYSHFSMIPLQKRITMLFNQPTKKMKKIAYLLVVPLTVTAAFAFAKRVLPEGSMKKIAVALHVAAPMSASDIIAARSSKELDYAGQVTEISGADLMAKEPALSQADSRADTITQDKVAITRESRLILSRLDPTALYSRATLQKESGEKFDRVIMRSSPDGGFAAVDVPVNGKVALVIQDKLYTENELDKAGEALAKQLHNNAHAAGENPGRKSKEVLGFDVSGFDGYISFYSGSPGTREVRVIGAVKNPGTYRISRDGSVFSLIQLAGGFTDNADRLTAYETHSNKVSYPFDLAKSLKEKSTLSSGDLLSLIIQTKEQSEQRRQIISMMIQKEIRAASLLRTDTAQYRAKAYAVDPNASLEILLRKLEGIAIDADKNISYKGKPVTLMLVNGKLIFNGDPKTAMQNLQAAMVDKVNVYLAGQQVKIDLLTSAR